MRIATVMVLVMLVLVMPAPLCIAAGPPSPKADASHKRGMRGEIKKLDLLLYDNPRGHEATATCSYTDERLLVKPMRELPPDRMKRFIFLAFVTTGALRNDDYMPPEKVYVGFGTECRVMTTNDAAVLQHNVKFGGDSGMTSGFMAAAGASKVSCPN